MKFTSAKRLGAIVGCAVALMGAIAPSVASADVTWAVNGTFDDGGTVTGTFNIDVYGELDGYDLTTAGGALSGFEYTPDNSYWDTGTFYIQAQPDYFGSLHLTFVGDLSAPSANNPIVGGAGGPSWECQGSFSCYLPKYGATRYITDGYAKAAVPEPATWGLMMVGLGAAGAMIRRRKRGQAVAAA